VADAGATWAHDATKEGVRTLEEMMGQLGLQI